MTERLMSARAAQRVADGATTGAGTDVCAKCEGDKEPGRLNSDRCAACNSPAKTKTKTTKAEALPHLGAGRGKVTKGQTIRTSVEQETYEALSAKAEAEGTNLAAVTRTLLIEWLGAEPTAPSEPPVSVEEKRMMKAWMTELSGEPTSEAHRQWRLRMDEQLREAVPDAAPLPLPDSQGKVDPLALLRWMHDANDVISAMGEVESPLPRPRL